jgi:glyoxylase-like metal-dependent hydrolase (beta-lactamase superfamily II)
MKKALKILLGLAVLPVLAHIALASSQQTQPAQAQATQNPMAAPPVVEKVKDNIYQIKAGGGANTGVFIGENEVLVIDAKTTPDAAKQMIAEIKKLTSNPIRMVVLTHSDGDHVGGLPGFPADIKIIAHEQTKKDIEEVFKEPEQRAYLPNMTLSDNLALNLGGEDIRLLHFGPAHTSGDVVVFFPKEKVAFVGDLLFMGRDPLIHRHKNGSFSGALKTLKSLLELDAEAFFSGHADVITKTDIETLIKSYEEKEAKIKALIQEGKTLEEIKQIFNIQDRPAQPGRPRFTSFVEVIYLELTEKK